MTQCLICGTEPSMLSPLYCLTCYIPIPQRGSDSTKIKPSDRQERMHVASEWVKSVKIQNEKSKQLLEDFGLEMISFKQLPYAMLAIGLEKLHFLSVEYNLAEAELYIDRAYLLSENYGDTELTNFAQYSYRIKNLRYGILSSNEELIYNKDFGYASLKNYLTLQLSNLFGGNYVQLEALNEIKDEVTSKLKKLTVKFTTSKRLTKDDNIELEELVSVQVLIIQIEIVQSKATLSDEVIDEIRKLGNFVVLAGELGKKDDPMYYASILRDYIQFSTGILWNPVSLSENDLDKTQLLVIQLKSIVDQWSPILPAQAWLHLSLARIFTILNYNSKWSNSLSPDNLQQFLENELIPPYDQYLDYILAEGLISEGKRKEALQQLFKLLNRDDLIEEIKEIGSKLAQKVLLENDGIYLGIPHKNLIDVLEAIVIQEDKIDHQTIAEQLASGSSLLEINSTQLIKFHNSSKVFPELVSVDGEVLENIMYSSLPNLQINQTILTVGSSYYRDVHWQTPFTSVKKRMNGIRNDIFIIIAKSNNESFRFMFQADTIPLNETETEIIIGTPKYYHLIGVSYENKEPDLILKTLSTILTDPESIDLILIYSLFFLSGK